MESVAKKGIKTLVKEVSANTPLTVPINPALGKCEWQIKTNYDCYSVSDHAGCQGDGKALSFSLSTKCSPKKGGEQWTRITLL